jgi:cytoplasmic iron level regulating protein YaaA (DUF328/UPF0246 family)
MILVVSPAKTLDYETELPTREFTEPDFLKESAMLIKELKKKSKGDIKSLMKLSDKLVDLNVERYGSWQRPFSPDNSRPGIFAFKGDVYVGLGAYSFTEADISFAQDHLRILSGLYGVLRPLDLMQPYRLEMGTRLENSRGKNLYEFWGSKISKSLDAAQAAGESEVLVNLASNEYFSAVDKKSLNARVVTPGFYDCKNGKYKIISFYAKKARGLMAAWIIKNRVTDPEEIKNFNVAGYSLCIERSGVDAPVFIREEQGK